MLFNLLKAFGIDIPARIEELRLKVEQRVERAADQAKHVAQDVAMTAALAGIAAVAAAAAIAIGLAALFHWVAETEGVYAAYSVIGGILLAVTAGLGGAAWARTRTARAEPAAERVLESARAGSIEQRAERSVWNPDAAAQPAANSAGVALGKVLAFLLPLFLSSPSRGAGAVEELAGSLATGGRNTVGEALDGAARLVRDGDRINLLAAVAGAMLFGWIMTRYSRREPR